MAADPTNSAHTALTGKPGFCPVRSEGSGKCACGNNHIKKCDPQPTWRPSEAHHLLCVDSVGQVLAKDDGMKAVLAATTWCINDTPNMYAMPLGATTVLHYCLLNFFGPAGAPSFANIPQHNYDHNCQKGYRAEVTAELSAVKANIKKAAHAVSKADIKGTLDATSAEWKGILQARGQRNGGTHNSWLAASGQPIPDSAPDKWFLPFSMASDGVASNRAFPIKNFDAKKARWLAHAVKILLGGG